MKEAAHLVRLAAILIAGVAAFAFARQAIAPAGFGQLGHYRPGALTDVRARPLTYAGRDACAACHDDAVQKLAASRHKAIGCEACHGPQYQHTQDLTKPALPETRRLCARCHESIAARPKWMPQVVSNDHAAGEPCKSCHEPHSPKLGG